MREIQYDEPMCIAVLATYADASTPAARGDIGIVNAYVNGATGRGDESRTLRGGLVNISDVSMCRIAGLDETDEHGHHLVMHGAISKLTVKKSKWSKNEAELPKSSCSTYAAVLSLAKATKVRRSVDGRIVKNCLYQWL